MASFVLLYMLFVVLLCLCSNFPNLVVYVLLLSLFCFDVLYEFYISVYVAFAFICVPWSAFACTGVHWSAFA